MTKLTSTPAGAVLVAIDMSKNRQEVLNFAAIPGLNKMLVLELARCEYSRAPNRERTCVAGQGGGSRQHRATKSLPPISMCL